MNSAAAAVPGGDSSPTAASATAWSDTVEDLVDAGDIDGAISLLESVISNLSPASPPPPSSNLRLAAALSDLADLHSSRGLSLKADALRSRALLLRSPAPARLNSPPRVRVPSPPPSAEDEQDEDDWEAIADRGGVEEVEVPVAKEAVASPSTSEMGKTKRRGRGSFLYQKSCLYSEQAGDDAGSWGHGEEDDKDGGGYSRYGTGHVLLLYDFPASTRTMELEKMFDGYRDRGVVIRWVNDTTALAVFRNPAIAHEAQRSVHCPFKIRTLAEDDDLLPQLSTKDLEPPYPRPKTSARTAQRLIAQGMGLKLPTDFGSNELRKQEEARKNRIHARQMLKEDAWGSDNPQ